MLPMTGDWTIRPARLDPERHPDDGAACAAIYAPYVRGTEISFETRPPDAAEFRRRMSAAHLWLVAEKHSRVVGFAYAAEFNQRAAYAWSTTVSVYLDPAAHGRGLGRALYLELFARLEAMGFRQVFAGVTQPNEASMALHRAVGLQECAHYRDVGFKHDRWLDVVWLQRSLGAGATLPPGPPPG